MDDSNGNTSPTSTSILTRPAANDGTPLEIDLSHAATKAEIEDFMKGIPSLDYKYQECTDYVRGILYVVGAGKEREVKQRAHAAKVTLSHNKLDDVIREHLSKKHNLEATDQQIVHYYAALYLKATKDLIQAAELTKQPPELPTTPSQLAGYQVQCLELIILNLNHRLRNDQYDSEPDFRAAVDISVHNWQMEIHDGWLLWMTGKRDGLKVDHKNITDRNKRRPGRPPGRLNDSTIAARAAAINKAQQEKDRAEEERADIERVARERAAAEERERAVRVAEFAQSQTELQEVERQRRGQENAAAQMQVALRAAQGTPRGSTANERHIPAIPRGIFLTPLNAYTLGEAQARLASAFFRDDNTGIQFEIEAINAQLLVRTIQAYYNSGEVQNLMMREQQAYVHASAATNDPVSHTRARIARHEILLCRDEAARIWMDYLARFFWGPRRAAQLEVRRQVQYLVFAAEAEFVRRPNYDTSIRPNILDLMQVQLRPSMVIPVWESLSPDAQLYQGPLQPLSVESNNGIPVVIYPSGRHRSG